MITRKYMKCNLINLKIPYKTTPKTFKREIVLTAD